MSQMPDYYRRTVRTPRWEAFALCVVGLMAGAASAAWVGLGYWIVPAALVAVWRLVGVMRHRAHTQPAEYVLAFVGMGGVGAACCVVLYDVMRLTGVLRAI